MDSEDHFWLGLWKAVIAGICVIAAIAGGCTANTHLAVSKDLQKGLDPLAVSCAHGIDNASSACMIIASKR